MTPWFRSKVTVEVPETAEVTRIGVIERPSTTFKVPEAGDTVTPVEGTARQETRSFDLEPPDVDASWTPSPRRDEPPGGTRRIRPDGERHGRGGALGERRRGGRRRRPPGPVGTVTQVHREVRPSERAAEGSHGLSHVEGPRRPDRQSGMLM